MPHLDWEYSNECISSDHLGGMNKAMRSGYTLSVKCTPTHNPTAAHLSICIFTHLPVYLSPIPRTVQYLSWKPFAKARASLAAAVSDADRATRPACVAAIIVPDTNAPRRAYVRCKVGWYTHHRFHSNTLRYIYMCVCVCVCGDGGCIRELMDS